MRAIYIIGEGPTEEEFINNVLRPYFNRFEINDVRAILLNTSPKHKGGAMTFARYHYNVRRLLANEADVIVTSLIDFFRLKTDFPGFAHALSIQDKIQRVQYLEDQISSRESNPRFRPYIQLHEFEGLLFSDSSGFNYLPEILTNNLVELQRIVDEHANPELLNDGQLTAPSKRLEHLIPSYIKALHGPIIAMEIGIDAILNKCPRFNNWTQDLIYRYRNTTI